MLTEQEAIAQLNEKIAKKQIKPATMKYLAKIKFLEEQLKTHQNQIKELSDKISGTENEIVRVRGAISMLLELAAEEEGLLADNQENSDKSSTPAE